MLARGRRMAYRMAWAGFMHHAVLLSWTNSKVQAEWNSGNQVYCSSRLHFYPSPLKIFPHHITTSSWLAPGCWCRRPSFHTNHALHSQAIIYQHAIHYLRGGSRKVGAVQRPPLSILCAKKSTSSTTSATAMKFTPFPFLNHNNMVSSTSSWSPMSYSSTTKNDECALPSDTRDNFSRYSKFLVKNFNIIYEGQYQRRRIQQVALSPTHQQPHHMPPSLSTTSSLHPHPWPKRLKRIVEILSHANPDVICLQECELQSFKYDLAPALSKFGYDGISQEDDRP